LDAELSLCCGLGSALGAGDIEIDLPNDEYPHDGDDEASASIFRRRVELALIHSAVRNHHQCKARSVGSLRTALLPKNELVWRV